MGGYLLASDVLSGQEGTVTFNVGGNVEVGAFVKKLTATLEKTKSELNTLGHRGTQTKSTGWKGTGEMTVYYVSSLFRKLARDYAKNGKDIYFDVTVENNDPTSTVGKQTVVLYRCNLDDTVLAQVDVEAENLEEELKFTFEDFEIIDQFTEPTRYGN